MSIESIRFTFNTDVKVNKKTVIAFKKAAIEKKDYSFDINQLMETLEFEEVNIEFINEIISRLQNPNSISWEGNDLERHLTFLVEEGLGKLSGISEILGIKYLYSDWDSDGADDYKYYHFVSKEKVISRAKEEIDKNVKLLRDCGLDIEVSILD